MRTFWLAFVPLAGTVVPLAALHPAGIGAASLIVLGAALCLRPTRRPAGRPLARRRRAPAAALAAARAAVAGLPPYRPVEVVPGPDSDRSAAVRAAVRTRLALQSTAALALAFTLGQPAFGRHWPWVVITVLAVSLRAASRGEVAVTTAERLLGALAGTVLATAVAALATPAPVPATLLVLAALGAGMALRPYGYACWAAAMTAPRWSTRTPEPGPGWAPLSGPSRRALSLADRHGMLSGWHDDWTSWT